MIPGIGLGLSFGSLFPLGADYAAIKEMVAQGNAAIASRKHPSGREMISRKNDHGMTANKAFAPIMAKAKPAMGDATGRLKETHPALQNFPIKERKQYTQADAAAMAEVANRIAAAFCGRNGIAFIRHLAGGLGASRVSAVDTERGYKFYGPRTGQLSSSFPNFIERKRTPAGRIYPPGSSPTDADYGLSGPGGPVRYSASPLTWETVQRAWEDPRKSLPLFPPVPGPNWHRWASLTPPGERCPSEDAVATGAYPANPLDSIDRGEGCSRLGEVEVAEPADRLLDQDARGEVLDYPSTADYDSTDSNDW